MSRLFGHGMSQQESHINWWVDHMHPDDRERVSARIRDHIDRREEYWLDEYRFRRGDNSYASVLDKGGSCSMRRAGRSAWSAASATSRTSRLRWKKSSCATGN
jgi:hypothetical protein